MYEKITIKFQFIRLFPTKNTSLCHFDGERLFVS